MINATGRGGKGGEIVMMSEKKRWTEVRWRHYRKSAAIVRSSYTAGDSFS
jgi:hypothetical protein